MPVGGSCASLRPGSESCVDGTRNSTTGIHTARLYENEWKSHSRAVSRGLAGRAREWGFVIADLAERIPTTVLLEGMRGLGAEEGREGDDNHGAGERRHREEEHGKYRCQRREVVVQEQNDDWARRSCATVLAHGPNASVTATSPVTTRVRRVDASARSDVAGGLLQTRKHSNGAKETGIITSRRQQLVHITLHSE